jgi:signal transduction histidine kinase
MASHLTLTMKLQIDLDVFDESWSVNPPDTLNRLKSSVVVGDPIKVAQVMRKLVSNALKFSPPGSEVKVLGKSFLLDLSTN